MEHSVMPINRICRVVDNMGLGDEGYVAYQYLKVDRERRCWLYRDAHLVNTSGVVPSYCVKVMRQEQGYVVDITSVNAHRENMQWESVDVGPGCTQFKPVALIIDHDEAP